MILTCWIVNIWISIVLVSAAAIDMLDVESNSLSISAEDDSKEATLSEQSIFPIGRSPRSQAKTPFPAWLTQFTGLTEWPGANPPYIPLDFIDFNKIEKYEPYKEGRCNKNPRESCSFDCHKCVAHDDVHSCAKLSQTFDDGPSVHTLTLLDKLQHKTTFFTLGMNVVERPEIYHTVMERGHLIGTHTWSHPFLPILWDHDTLDWLAASNPFQRTESAILKDVTEWKRTSNGLILEHDGSKKTVDIAMKVNDIIGSDQMTAAQCVGGIDYIKEFKV
ncbi:chitin deacetylase [Kluyveromyces marxianus]|nr:chitin deacetylase [Kluyveromyces marxianus]